MTLFSRPGKEMFGKKLESVHVQSEVCDIRAVLFVVSIRICASARQNTTGKGMSFGQSSSICPHREAVLWGTCTTASGFQEALSGSVVGVLEPRWQPPT